MGKYALFLTSPANLGGKYKNIISTKSPCEGNLCGLEPQLIKLEFIIYLPKLKVSPLSRFSKVGTHDLHFGCD